MRITEDLDFARYPFCVFNSSLAWKARKHQLADRASGVFVIYSEYAEKLCGVASICHGCGCRHPARIIVFLLIRLQACGTFCTSVLSVIPLRKDSNVHRALRISKGSNVVSETCYSKRSAF